MNASKIILVGMPGAGKSTFGMRLAGELAYEFVDLDDAIERHAGQSIPTLFKISEEHFRAQETAALRAVLEDPRPLIIASGGGTPCFNDNMSMIHSQGLSIFLDPPLSVLVHRTERETHRPLLQGRNIVERLQELYQVRQEYYQQANIRLTEESPNPKEVIRLLSRVRN